MIIEITEGDAAASRRLDLDKPEVLVGKQADCDVVLSSPKVSRRHARLAIRDGALVIEDLKSTNGTSVNGQSVSGSRAIGKDDVITIAAFKLRVTMPEAPVKAAPIDSTIVKAAVDVGRPVQATPGPEQTVAGGAAPDPALDATIARPVKKEAAKPEAAKPEAAKPAPAAQADVMTTAPKKPPPAAEETDEAKKAKMFWASMESFFGPIWTYIDDASVSEIMVNGPREIFFERKGKVERAPVTFTEEGLRAAVMNVAQYVGKRVNEENPYMDARLPDGSRVAVVLPPCSRKGPCIAIRKFSKEKLTLQDLIKFGSMSEEVVAFLDIAVKLRKNIIVSGGTSSGKTSLLNVVSALIPNDQRIIVIEDSAELQLQQEHVLPLESKPPDKHGKGEVTLRELVRASLRLRPDRVVVGEVRGGEALDLLQAMNTGHSGSLATIHASSPAQTLSRLETLTLFSGLDLPIVAIREQVSTAIDIIIQAARLQDGSRKVTHISQVLPMSPEGRYRVQDIYRYFRTGMEKERILGEHRAAGNLPTFLEEIELAGFAIPPALAEIASRPGAREAMEHKATEH